MNLDYRLRQSFEPQASIEVHLHSIRRRRPRLLSWSRRHSPGTCSDCPTPAQYGPRHLSQRRSPPCARNTRIDGHGRNTADVRCPLSSRPVGSPLTAARRPCSNSISVSVHSMQQCPPKATPCIAARADPMISRPTVIRLQRCLMASCLLLADFAADIRGTPSLPG